jgi:hypothetical protein
MSSRRSAAGADGPCSAGAVCGGHKLFILPIVGVLASMLATLGWFGDRMRSATGLEAPATGPLKRVVLNGDWHRPPHPEALWQRLDRRSRNPP